MKKVFKILLRILLILLILYLLLFAGLCLLLEFGFHPVQITRLGQTDRQRITDCTGISLPSDVKYVDGWHIPGRDPSYLYIFDLDASQKAESETEDAYLRRVLQLSGYSAAVDSNFSSLQRALPDLDEHFRFMSEYQYVDPSQCHYAYIHYRVAGNTIRFALQFGFT